MSVIAEADESKLERRPKSPNASQTQHGPPAKQGFRFWFFFRYFRSGILSPVPAANKKTQQAGPSGLSKDKRFVLAVDLDGVVADFYAALRPIAAEWRGVPLKALPAEVSYGLPEWGISGTDYQDLHRFAVTQRDLFLKEKPIAGAAPVLRRLGFNDSIRVRIITHRLYIKYTHEICVRHTTKWLESHGIPYWDICFMKEKGEVGADLYIEDSPGNIRALRDEGKEVLIFSNSTNRLEAGQRASNWREVERIVLVKVAQWKKAIGKAK